jgi:subtilisin family serine protease
VAAPGVNVISGYPLLMWAIGSGTSYASPLVAGEAALIKSIKPNLTPEQVLQIIQNTADDVSAANGGASTTRINAYNAGRSAAGR